MVSVAECEGMHVALFPLSPCVLSLSLISLVTLSSCVTESETMRVALSFFFSLSLSLVLSPLSRSLIISPVLPFFSSPRGDRSSSVVSPPRRSLAQRRIRVVDDDLRRRRALPVVGGVAAVLQ
jgi:hypothetical protein